MNKNLMPLLRHIEPKVDGKLLRAVSALPSEGRCVSREYRKGRPNLAQEFPEGCDFSEGVGVRRRWVFTKGAKEEADCPGRQPRQAQHSIL